MKIFKEFKEFITQGNVLGLAVGIIIGGTFKEIVNSLVDNIINPLLGLFVNVDFSDLVLTVGGTTFRYGSFIMSIINFLLVAFSLFFVVKAINHMQRAAMEILPIPEEEPKEKECPYCTRKIPVNAKRCPECTSELEE